MARRFTRGRGRLGSTREMSWLEIEPTRSTLSNAVAISHTMTAAELAKRPFTVVRTHLFVSMSSDQNSANEDQVAGIGLCVVSSQAVATGVAAVPTPITDLSSDLWFVHQLMMSDYTFQSATGTNPRAGLPFEIDSKAMRKVNDDQEIIVCTEVSSLGDGASMLIGGRLLIKES